MKLSGLAHLKVPVHARIDEMTKNFIDKKKRFFEKYDDIWRSKRAQVKQRLIQANIKPAGKFQVGSKVRVYRPSISKVAVKWSEPREIVDSPTSVTREVLREDGTKTIEHIVNLQEAL